MVSDVDRFLRRVYRYYAERGFTAYLLHHAGNMLIQIVVFLLILFTFMGVDFPALSAAVAQATHPVDVLDYVELTVTWWGVVFAVWFGVFLLFEVYTVMRDLTEMWEIRRFYIQVLALEDEELRGTLWGEVMERISLRAGFLFDLKEPLDAHAIVARIMRRDNYELGLWGQRVMVPSVTLPVLGRVPFLSKALQLCSTWVIHRVLFRGRGSLEVRRVALDRDRRDDHVAALSRWFRLTGVAILLLWWMLVPSVLAYYFFRYTDEFRRRPSSPFTERRWGREARMALREFNELPHVFEDRQKRANRPGMAYIAQFESPVVAIVARFVTYVVGAAIALLLLAQLLDNNMMIMVHLFGQNFFWYNTILLTVIVYARSLIPPEDFRFAPEADLAGMMGHMHLYNSRWKAQARRWDVSDEVRLVFVSKAWYMMVDIVGAITVPFQLLLAMPRRSEAIVDFILSTTTASPHGYMCAYATFADADFARFGSASWGSRPSSDTGPWDVWRLEGGRMERSLVSFRSLYPQWLPSRAARQIIVRLWDFDRQDRMAKARAQARMPFASVMEADAAAVAEEVARDRDVEPEAEGEGSPTGTSPAGSLRLESLVKSMTDRNQFPALTAADGRLDLSLSQVHERFHEAQLRKAGPGQGRA